MSTPNAGYCTGDISNIFYAQHLQILNKFVPLPTSSSRLSSLPTIACNPLIHNGNIYTSIKKAWHGLSNNLVKLFMAILLRTSWNTNTKSPPNWGPILAWDTRHLVDLRFNDFDIKCTHKENINHLLANVCKNTCWKWTGTQHNILECTSNGTMTTGWCGRVWMATLNRYSKNLNMAYQNKSTTAPLKQADWTMTKPSNT